MNTEQPARNQKLGDSLRLRVFEVKGQAQDQEIKVFLFDKLRINFVLSLQHPWLAGQWSAQARFAGFLQAPFCDFQAPHVSQYLVYPGRLVPISSTRLEIFYNEEYQILQGK